MVAYCVRDTNILIHLFPMHPFSSTSKNMKTLWYSDVFRGQRKGTLETDGLNTKKSNTTYLFNWKTSSSSNSIFVTRISSKQFLNFLNVRLIFEKLINFSSTKIFAPITWKGLNIKRNNQDMKFWSAVN